MKRWIQVAALAGLCVFSASALAVASSGSQDIQVFYRDIKLVVNGAPVSSSSEPFIYNGATYVPLRAISEALGQDIKWDGDTGTVYIGRNPAGKLLTDMSPYHTNSDYWAIDNAQVRQQTLTGKPMTMGGTAYTKGLMVTTYRASEVREFDWNLNGQYATLSGLVGLDDKYKNQHITITISGDDQQITQITLNPGDLPKPVQISVKGVLRLKVEVATPDGWDNSAVDMVNMIIK